MKLFPTKSYASGDNIFFTSDTHFGHAKIIEYCKRPFGSVEEMNEALIDNWNAKVPVDGIVYHLGDFAFGGWNFWTDMASRLNGHIMLCVGNHDRDQLTDKAFGIFDDIKERYHLKIGVKKIIIQHEPLAAFEGSYRGEFATWNLYGHIHSGPQCMYGEDVKRVRAQQQMSQYDVGVDNNGYVPISFNELKGKIYEQQMSQNLIL